MRVVHNRGNFAQSILYRWVVVVQSIFEHAPVCETTTTTTTMMSLARGCYTVIIHAASCHHNNNCLYRSLIPAHRRTQILVFIVPAKASSLAKTHFAHFVRARVIRVCAPRAAAEPVLPVRSALIRIYMRA